MLLLPCRGLTSIVEHIHCHCSSCGSSRIELADKLYALGSKRSISCTNTDFWLALTGFSENDKFGCSQSSHRIEILFGVSCCMDTRSRRNCRLSELPKPAIRESAGERRLFSRQDTAHTNARTLLLLLLLLPVRPTTRSILQQPCPSGPIDTFS